MEEAIGRLESGLPDMHVERRGYIVNLAADPEPAIRLRDAEVRMLTKTDVLEAGFVSAEPLESESLLPVPPLAGLSNSALDPDDRELRKQDEQVRVPTNASLYEVASMTHEEPEPDPLSNQSTSPPTPSHEEGADEDTERDREPAPGGEESAEPAGSDIDVALGLTEIDQDSVVWRPRVQGVLTCSFSGYLVKASPGP